MYVLIQPREPTSSRYEWRLSYHHSARGAVARSMTGCPWCSILPGGIGSTLRALLGKPSGMLSAP